MNKNNLILFNKLSPFDKFEITSMIIDDYNERQKTLIENSIAEYINKNYVDVKELAIGDKKCFYFKNNSFIGVKV